MGSRRRLAASTIPHDGEALDRWLRRPEAVKPGALMPGYDGLGGDRLQSLSAYLRELR